MDIPMPGFLRASAARWVSPETADARPLVSAVMDRASEELAGVEVATCDIVGYSQGHA